MIKLLNVLGTLGMWFDNLFSLLYFDQVFLALYFDWGPKQMQINFLLEKGYRHRELKSHRLWDNSLAFEVKNDVAGSLLGTHTM